MTRDPDGASLAGAIMQGANRTFLVPAVLAQVLQSGDDAVKLFGSLKTYSYGASPMPVPLLRAAMEAWPDTDFIQVYGLTELCGVITHLLPEAHRDAGHPERLVSAGQCIPGAEVRVVDPDTLEDVPTGEHGELWFRTPQLMKGYLNKPEATAEVITEDGWFRTGDMGRVDAGRLRLRRGPAQGHDHLRRGEHLLARGRAGPRRAPGGDGGRGHRRARRALGRGGQGGRRRSTRAREATEEELIACCREHLAHYKCPKSVDIIEALPRNPTGKILKRDLRSPTGKAATARPSEAARA